MKCSGIRLHIVRSLKMCMRMPLLEVCMRAIRSYFSKTELALWSVSVLFIIMSFLIFDRESGLTLIASLIGVTSLIFNAKGNPVGQVLMIVFSVIYGVISYAFAYYGEMLTYLGMTMPMACFALISWRKNPYNGNKAEVRVSGIGKKEQILMWFLTLAVTVVFGYILKRFHTANIVPSTISVTTSFLAAYLTFRRCPAFALAYAANDIVLIVLWVLASISDAKYISVVVCFLAFLANDIYGYVSWRKMKWRQAENQNAQ